jgi:hypothetical protein
MRSEVARGHGETVAGKSVSLIVERLKTSGPASRGYSIFGREIDTMEYALYVVHREVAEDRL